MNVTFNIFQVITLFAILQALLMAAYLYCRKMNIRSGNFLLASFFLSTRCSWRAP